MGPNRILVPVKGDDADEQALRLACSLVRKNKGKLFVLYVIEVERKLPVETQITAGMEHGEAVLGRMEQVASEEKCTIEAELLQAREAGPAVVEEAMERQADLIIMGVSYKRRHGEFNLGSTVPYVLKRAPCRVWVSREPLTNGATEGVAREQPAPLRSPPQ